MTCVRLAMIWALAFASLGAVIGLDAQDVNDADDPTHGVARVSLIYGEVNVVRGDSGEVVAAALNAPLVAQDRIQTGTGSRSELQFDSANLIRLGPDSELIVAAVQRDSYQLQLGRGDAIYRVLRDSQAQAEIDTPSISFRPLTKGIFRVGVLSDGTTQLTVRAGEADVYSARGSQRLGAGQTMLVRGTSADPEFQRVAEIHRDPFDDWSARRDEQLLRSRSYQYVASDIYGADDLDGYGEWVPSSYGQVWAPRVAAGWAPYQNGRWVWVDYYGWTWVDYAPWGWAPFHYGRWFWNGPRGWCWWPGAMRQRYYWRPALVGFFGFGSAGFSLSFGNVGWVPLAPHEPWHAWYGRAWYGGRGYPNQTIVNNISIYNAYRNARVVNGVTYTRFDHFGRPGGQFYAVQGSRIPKASSVRGALPISPDRTSLAFSRRGNPQMARASFTGQRFFTHTPVRMPERHSFNEQQRRMGQYQERALGIRPSFQTGQGRSGWQGSQPQAGDFGSRDGTVRSRMVAEQNQGRPASRDSQGWDSTSGGGWRRFGQPGPNAPPNSNREGNRNSPEGSRRPDDGWHRFGQSSQPDAGRSHNDARTPGTERPNVGARGNRNPERSGEQPARSGWSRFGDPGRSSAFQLQERNTPQRSSGSDGWHRFGAPSDQRPFRGSGAGFSGNGRSENSMRMSQPIVRDRPGSFGGRSGAAEPRFSRPMNGRPHEGATARPNMAAPRSGGNRGGGSPSRSGGNHGGGGHHH